MLFGNKEQLQNENKTLLIRADANSIIGTGHVMRCLALAQVWRESVGPVTFLMTPGTSTIEQRIRSEGMNILPVTAHPGSIEDAEFTAGIAEEIKSLWVIVDGYQFGAEFQDVLKQHACRVLFIDDYGHADHYSADIVLNQNIYADMSYYRHKESYTRFLLGTRYVLLRKEFLPWGGMTRKIPKVARKLLVTMGGSDPENITSRIIEILKNLHIEGFELIVVVGGLNPNLETIKESLKNHPAFSVKGNVENMPEIMAWADVAISAGGSTSWELAYTGLPSILIILSDDQEFIVSELSKRGVAVSLGRSDEFRINSAGTLISDLIYSSSKRYNMCKRGIALVDGRGPIRIISEMLGEETVAQVSK